jgi:hypothetical protein
MSESQDAPMTSTSSLSRSWRLFTEDLRFASRRLWRSRGFAIVAVAMLALGIGANIAMFTVAKAFQGFTRTIESCI